MKPLTNEPKSRTITYLFKLAKDYSNERRELIEIIEEQEIEVRFDVQSIASGRPQDCITIPYIDMAKKDETLHNMIQEINLHPGSKYVVGVFEKKFVDSGTSTQKYDTDKGKYIHEALLEIIEFPERDSKRDIENQLFRFIKSETR